MDTQIPQLKIKQKHTLEISAVWKMCWLKLQLVVVLLFLQYTSKLTISIKNSFIVCRYRYQTSNRCLSSFSWESESFRETEIHPVGVLLFHCFLFALDSVLDDLSVSVKTLREKMEFLWRWTSFDFLWLPLTSFDLLIWQPELQAGQQAKFCFYFFDKMNSVPEF